MKRHFFTWACTFLVCTAVLWGLFDAHLGRLRSYAAEKEIFDVYSTPSNETAFCLFGNRYILNKDAVNTAVYSAKEAVTLEGALLPNWLAAPGALWGETFGELAGALGELMDA